MLMLQSRKHCSTGRQKKTGSQALTLHNRKHCSICISRQAEEKKFSDAHAALQETLQQAKPDKLSDADVALEEASQHLYQ